ncbi:MAG: hypothetical protein H7175_24620 [Burkholderiales bacterium]|nr:hypothetical protein [Anaerolineae bacterium]
MRLQKKSSKSKYGAPKQSKNRKQPAETVSPQPDTEWIARAVESPEKLSPSAVTQLRRMIGNQAVSQLVAHPEARPNLQRKPAANSLLQSYAQRSPIAVNTNAIHATMIQRWPTPEVNDTPEKATIGGNFKCHDAVVFWVLLSLGIPREEAINGIKLINTKRGPSGGWVSQAMGYDSGTRIDGAGDTEVGDILYLPNKTNPAHSMIVIPGNRIKGFNNAGTFGTVDGDTYSEENIADNSGHWHGDIGDRKLGFAIEEDPGNPVFKIGIASAQSKLNDFIHTVGQEEPDYNAVNTHMNLTKKNPPNNKKCYITTAVTMTRGLPDDCDELTALRAFRDDYLLELPNGEELVALYYDYAPLILEEIAKQKDAGAVFGTLYDVIRSCVDAIKNGDNEFAYQTYCRMVIKLQEEYLPDLTMPAYQI